MRNSLIKDDILEEICAGKPVSGGLLAGKLGVSRTAVWKAVNALRSEGYSISGEAGGYALSPYNTRLCGEQLRANVGGNIIFKRETVSTNEDAKALGEAGAGEFTVVVAGSQTGGKGRRGREFVSAPGGLYFSVLLRPDLPVDACLKITTAAAVAVARAIEKVSAKTAKIKWVNDIYIRDRKVCGILTEGAFESETGRLKYAVLGVGVNVATPKVGFPPEIAETAGALFDTSTPPSLVYCALLSEFLAVFKEYYGKIAEMPHIREYASRSYLSGRTVTYTKGGKERKGKVIGIGENAELIIKDGLGKTLLTSGEVQITGYEK